jgi:hypothetical protein
MPKGDNNRKVLTGQAFGQLTVMERAGTDHRGEIRWLCSCECGNLSIALGSNLRTGNTQSCGCLKRKIIQAGANFKHGMNNTPEHRAWSHMRQRCNNPKDKSYKDYGARGITVCDRWQDSFPNFMEDMGLKPEPKHKYSLERKNNEEGYSPDNCVWATRRVQAKNKRNIIYWTYQGKTQHLSAWAEELGIEVGTLWYRHKAGWPVEKILGTPVKH